MSKVLNSKSHSAFNSDYKINFNSIVSPENETDFDYLSKFFKTRNISNENKKKELLIEEE